MWLLSSNNNTESFPRQSFVAVVVVWRQKVCIFCIEEICMPYVPELHWLTVNGFIYNEFDAGVF